MMPVVSQLQDRLGDDAFSLHSPNSVKGRLSHANLILTSDQRFHDEVREICSEAEIELRMLRPRKLAAFEGVPDLLD